MTPEKIRILQKKSHTYLKSLPKEKEILEQDVYSYFKTVASVILPEGTDEEKEKLESYLTNGWLVTHEYKHRQEMIEEADLIKIKEYLKDIDVPEVINNWLRSSISNHKPEVFKCIAEYKNPHLDIHLGKLSVIYGEYETLMYCLNKNPKDINELLYTSLMSDNKEMGLFLIENGASVSKTHEVIKNDVKSDAWVIIKYQTQLKWLEEQENIIKLKERLQSNLEEKDDIKKVKI